MASAGTSCGSCPVPAHHATFTCPRLNYPHLPRPVWVHGLPTNLPTCQPDSRMRWRLATRWGPATLQYSLHSPYRPSAPSQRLQACRLTDMPRAGEEGKDRAASQGWKARGAVELCRSNKVGPSGLAPSVKSRSDLPKPCTHRNIVPFHPQILSASLPAQQPSHHKAPARQHAAVCRVSLDRLRPNIIRCQPARREQPLRAECQEPRMLTGICSRHLPCPVPTASIDPCNRRFVPFLRVSSAVLCAPPTSKHPRMRDSRLFGPRLLVLSFSLGAEEWGEKGKGDKTHWLANKTVAAPRS